MKGPIRSTWLLFALFLTVTAGLGIAHSDPPAPAYSTSVAIVPTGADTFQLNAEVTDGAGEVIAAPTLKMAASDTAEVKSTLPDTTEVIFSATINEMVRSASYSITVSKAGKTLVRHTAKVVL